MSSARLSILDRLWKLISGVNELQMSAISDLKSDHKLWELFTGKEEYNRDLRDEYERFPYWLSEHRHVFEPEVSQFFVKNGLNAKYPGDKKFAVCLTHDIDIVTYSGLKMPYEAAQALIKGKLGRALCVLLNKVSKKLNPIWNFRQIIEIERKYDARSSFYFLALEKGEKDFNFRVGALKNELQTIAESGCEIGLHGGHGAFNNLDELKKQKERIEEVLSREVTGYRNHYLRFEVPTTWEMLKKAGFKYDTTFGYADCVGFRNGMCHPFKPYNLNSNQFIDILEIPLTIMDCTFDLYMRLGFEDSWKLARQLIDRVAELNGVMTILWHNTYMLDEQLEFYERILACCREKSAWMTSGEEIRKWWDENKFIEYGQ